MKNFLLAKIVFLILCTNVLAQRTEIPGQMIQSGGIVLDPNQDGYVSKASTGFSDPLNDVGQFEIAMFGIPIFGEGESVGDISAGKDCGVVDLALDTAGYALYAALDDDKNLIFRFRVAGNQNSVESYSVLIDTDNLVGSADANSNSANPGFEYAITLVQNRGVYFYDIDGLSSLT